MKQQRTKLRRRNMIGFTLSALIVHIVLPLVLDNPDLYLFAIPLPWSNTPLQAAVPKFEFYQNHVQM